MKKESTGQYAIFLGDKTFRIPTVIKLRKLVLREKLFAGDYVYLYGENRWELACNLPELLDLFPERHKQAYQKKQQFKEKQASSHQKRNSVRDRLEQENTEYCFGQTQNDGFLSQAPIQHEDPITPRQKHRRMLEDMYNIVQSKQPPAEGSTELDVIGTTEMEFLGKPNKLKIASHRMRSKMSEAFTLGKTKRTLALVMLLVFALGTGYWLGSSSQPGFLDNIQAVAFFLAP